MRTTCHPGSENVQDSLQRRQSMTTWGIVALAVFVAVGMAEWSKRQAAGETVIDPVVMEQAVKMAAAAAAEPANLNHGSTGQTGRSSRRCPSHALEVLRIG